MGGASSWAMTFDSVHPVISFGLVGWNAPPVNLACLWVHDFAHCRALVSAPISGAGTRRISLRISGRALAERAACPATCADQRALLGGSHVSGGHSSNCGRSSLISCHRALEPTKICDSGFMPGSPSTVPNVIVVTLPLTVPANEEPHSLQKHHPASGNDSNTLTRSSPEVHSKSSELNLA